MWESGAACADWSASFYADVKDAAKWSPQRKIQSFSFRYGTSSDSVGTDRATE